MDVNIAIQKALKDAKLYSDIIDGKLGPISLAAIDKWIRSFKVNPEGWSKSRLKIAAEQLLYKTNKIDVGVIDGFETHNLERAREIWNAQQVLTGRDAQEELAPELIESGVIKPIPVKVSGKITPVKSWPRQKDCTSFFGKVGTNQVSCKMPYQMAIAWDQKNKITSFSCHKFVQLPIERIFQRTLDYYGYEKIKELGLHLWGGCLNVRKKRGGSTYSMHSWGIAVDMDPERNGFKTPWKKSQMCKPEYKKFVEFWYDEGAINLGIEANMDPMHFQFARL